MKKCLRKPNYIYSKAVAFLIISFYITGVYAQFRNYNIVYSDNAKGNIVMFGNTLMAIIDNSAVNTVKMNDNAANGNSTFGNDFENMQYVDVDGKTFTGIGTRNSSTAEFNLSQTDKAIASNQHLIESLGATENLNRVNDSQQHSREIQTSDYGTKRAIYYANYTEFFQSLKNINVGISISNLIEQNEQLITSGIVIRNSMLNFLLRTTFYIFIYILKTAYCKLHLELTYINIAIGSWN